jgi:hypothetical protein
VDMYESVHPFVRDILHSVPGPHYSSL